MNNLYRSFANERNNLLLILVYIIALLFACSKMSPLYLTNEWTDVNIYFNVAKGMVNCRPLYTESFDHKGPLIFFIYALGYIISNTSFFGMFLIQIVAWVTLAYAIYFMAKMFLGRVESMVITFIFFIFLVNIMKAGGSAEEFILCLMGVSMALLIRYFRDKEAPAHKPVYMLIHGITSSAVFFIKINLVVFWIFPLLAIFLTILLRKDFKNLLTNIFAYIAGFLIVALPIIGYLWYTDSLVEAYRVYIELNRKYAKMGGIGGTALLLIFRVLYLWIDPLPLILLGPIGNFYFPKYIKNTLGKWAIILAGLSMYTAICMGGKFQYYYPIPLLIFSFLGLIAIGLILKKYIHINKIPAGTMFLVATVFAFWGMSMKGVRDTRIEAAFVTPVLEDGESTDDINTSRVRRAILKEKDPTLLNLGFGLANNLFTTCDIVPNVRYFVRPNLPYDIYPQLRESQFGYIRDKKTKFVVIQSALKNPNRVHEGQSYEDTPAYLRNLPILNQNYQLIVTDTLINRVDENSPEVYYLYKLKDLIKQDSINAK